GALRGASRAGGCGARRAGRPGPGGGMDRGGAARPADPRAPHGRARRRGHRLHRHRARRHAARAEPRADQRGGPGGGDPGDRLGRRRLARRRAGNHGPCQRRRRGHDHRPRALHRRHPTLRRTRGRRRSLMLARRLIPCLDVKDGRVVKGVRFVDLVDAGDPVEIANRYDAEGADELTFLDITASHERRPIILDVVARTAERIFMPLTVGGGVRTLEDVRALLRAGADKVSINTAAVERPEFVREAAERFGTQCVVVAIDARRRVPDDPGRGWEVYTHGGRTPSGRDAVAWAVEVTAAGAGEILLTSMDRDGTRLGY